jgi:hypothetical protein
VLVRSSVEAEAGQLEDKAVEVGHLGRLLDEEPIEEELLERRIGPKGLRR